MKTKFLIPLEADRDHFASNHYIILKKVFDNLVCFMIKSRSRLLTGLFLFLFTFPAFSMTSGNFGIQEDTINSGGNDISTSTNFKTLDSFGEIQGISTSSNYIMQSGYRKTENTSTTPVVIITFGGGPYIFPEDLGKIKVVPLIENFSATALTDTIKLSWTNPEDQNFQKIKIIRSDIFFTENINGGDLIYEGSGTTTEDFEVDKDKFYYYSAFSIDKDGNIGNPKIAMAKVISKPKEEKPIENVPEEVFEKAPEPGVILKLPDFAFYQNDKALQGTEKEIFAESGKAIKILVSEKILDSRIKFLTLETIDPQNKTETYSFLKDNNGNFYVVITNTNNIGDYKFKITAYDGNNKILGDIDGVLKLSPTPYKFSFFDTLKLIKFNWLWLLVLIIILIFFLIYDRDKKKKEKEERNPNDLFMP